MLKTFLYSLPSFIETLVFLRQCLVLVLQLCATNMYLLSKTLSRNSIKK